MNTALYIPVKCTNAAKTKTSVDGNLQFVPAVCRTARSKQASGQEHSPTSTWNEIYLNCCTEVSFTLGISKVHIGIGAGPADRKSETSSFLLCPKYIENHCVLYHLKMYYVFRSTAPQCIYLLNLICNYMQTC